MARSPRAQKVNRLLRGAEPRVLDLFAGCGGLSLGFMAAGFKIIGAVENDEVAVRSHGINFFKNEPEEVRERNSRPLDITKIEPGELAEQLGWKYPDKAVDVIVGGPPCQAFARVGRAKLREVEQHPKAFLHDPRANLYLRFVHYIRELKPILILMENVPDALNYGGHNIAEEMCDVLADLGYASRYTLLNAVFYGVPQMRERMFLLACCKELKCDITFPQPSHWAELPQGYEGSRRVALKSLGPPGDLFDTGASSGYTLPPMPSRHLPPAITAREAISDLPPITIHLEGKLSRGARRFDQRVSYPKGSKVSEYARMMRTWNSFESKNGICDHVIRYLPRDYDIFRRMNPGDQYPEAYQHATEMFETKLKQARMCGKVIIDNSAEYKKLKKLTVPPYDIGKFPNRWRKMEADKPARTLMAHLGKDSYSHIHYDSNQARTISVREAARLQSFPDGFVFAGTMNPAFRQIGNAVPPLLAKALAEQIMKGIRSERNG